MIGIYKITSPTGKIYIGQSVDIDRRFSEHRSKSKLKKNKLNNSFLKHGVENHKFEIIIECSVNELNFYERYYQDYYNTLTHGLNSILTKTNDKSGYLCSTVKEKIKNSNNFISKEKRLKMSLAQTGKIKPLSVRLKISNSSIGKKHTDLTKQKISIITKNISQETRDKYKISHLGKVQKEETKLKISNALKNRKRPLHVIEKIKKSKGIKVLNKITGEEYNSVKEVALILNCNISNLHLKLKGKRNNNSNFVYK